MAITRTVFIESVVLRIEGPELLLARDTIGTPYLCALVSRDDDGDRFVAVKVSGERYSEIRCGRIDLRTALSRPETAEFFVGAFARIQERPAITLKETKPFGERWLPKPDLFVTDFVEAPDDPEVLALAMAHQATTIVCKLNPPESQGLRPKIHADRLVDYIAGFQQLVKQVISKAQKVIDVEAYTLSIPAFSPGSFQIQFEAHEEQARLFDGTVMGNAMRTIDALVDVLNKPTADILRVAQENRGLVIAAYRNFLEFAGEQKTPVEYRWAEPSAMRSHHRQIQPELARAVSAVLDTHEDLGVETVTFLGTFFKADDRRGTWGARDEQTGKSRYGSLHEESPTLLRGVIINTQRYLIICEARLERTADGRSTTKLVLKDHKEPPSGQFPSSITTSGEHTTN